MLLFVVISSTVTILQVGQYVPYSARITFFSIIFYIFSCVVCRFFPYLSGSGNDQCINIYRLYDFYLMAGDPMFTFSRAPVIRVDTTGYAETRRVWLNCSIQHASSSSPHTSSNLQKFRYRTPCITFASIDTIYKTTRRSKNFL